MTYHGALGLLLFAIILALEPVVTGNPFTFLSYSSDIYWKMLGSLVMDTIACNSMTIAFQSGASGFVALISYVGIVYALLSDLIIFNFDFTYDCDIQYVLIFRSNCNDRFGAPVHRWRRWSHSRHNKSAYISQGASN